MFHNILFREICDVVHCPKYDVHAILSDFKPSVLYHEQSYYTLACLTHQMRTNTNGTFQARSAGVNK